ncbi:MAG: hypothetical protein OEY85_04640, partial [Rhodospirillales bacterium]|nr:hypothetical protein [Rhodospirillales bacterium]
RGEGGAVDDLYALGVSLVFHLLGYNPLADMTDNDLIVSKIEQGTYATLCGKTRIPISMLEPVRGFLTDDPDERWGLESLEMWLGGRQSTPIQKKVIYKSDTPFTFMDKKHFTTRTLALSFSQNTSEALRVIKEGGLGKWIRKDFGNVIMADDYENEIEVNTKTELVPVGGEEVFISKICMILDPLAPIHFKGLSFMPKGFGWVLATEVLQRGDAQRAAEALSKSLPAYWVSAQLEYSPEHSNLNKEFKQLRGFLQINDLGYGLERCLYELNKYLPCQSPFVSKEHVIHVYDLMFALDRISSSVDNSLKPIDRHIAAFVSAKVDHDISPHLKSLASPLPDKSIIGILSLLAFLQWRLKIDALHGLSSWVGGLLKPAVDSYHSRKVRKEVQREVTKCIDTGILPELFDVIDNSAKRNKDIEGFKAAVKQFAETESELKSIDVTEAGSSESAEHLGRQAAAMISVIISLITVSITFLMKIW